MKSPEHRAEMAARAARRAARADRQVTRKINSIATRELMSRITHNSKTVTPHRHDGDIEQQPTMEE